MKKSTLKFLDHIQQPVFMLAKDGALTFSNPNARDALARLPSLAICLGEVGIDVASKSPDAFPLTIRLPGDLAETLGNLTLLHMGSFIMALGASENHKEHHAVHNSRLGALDVLNREIAAPLREILEETKALAKATRAASEKHTKSEEQLAHIEEKLAAFDNIERMLKVIGEQEYNDDQRTDPNEMFEALRSKAAPAAAKWQISLGLRLPDNPLPTMYGPTSWFEQILHAYVHAAIRGTEPGSRLAIQARHLSGFLYVNFVNEPPGDDIKVSKKKSDESPLLGIELAGWLLRLLGGSVSIPDSGPSTATLQLPMMPQANNASDPEQEQLTRFTEELEALMALKQATTENP